MSDQQLGYFIVTVGACVVEGDQTAGGGNTELKIFTPKAQCVADFKLGIGIDSVIPF